MRFFLCLFSVRACPRAHPSSSSLHLYLVAHSVYGDVIVSSLRYIVTFIIHCWHISRNFITLVCVRVCFFLSSIFSLPFTISIYSNWFDYIWRCHLTLMKREREKKTHTKITNACDGSNSSNENLYIVCGCVSCGWSLRFSNIATHARSHTHNLV